VRALRSADVFVATGFKNNAKPAEIVLGDWQPDGTTFRYTTQSRMVVFRKHFEAGQELDVPPGGKFRVILLFPK
jgi:hypothetical protein